MERGLAIALKSIPLTQLFGYGVRSNPHVALQTDCTIWTRFGDYRRRRDSEVRETDLLLLVVRFLASVCGIEE